MADVTHNNLAEALSAAQAEYPDVPKNRTATVKGKNKQTGEFYEYTYKYADFADVLKAVRPVLAKHGLCFYQPIRRKEVKLQLTTTIKHVSGELIESDGLPIPEIMAPQELGSLLSYWRRYDGCALLGIQPDEDDDARRAALADSKGKGDRFAKQDAKIEKQGNDNRISERDVRAFWSAVNSSGKKPQEIKVWLKEKRYGSIEEIPKEQAPDAIKWALSGGTVVPKDLVGVMQQSVDLARGAAMKRLFGVAGEYHISEADVKQASYERFKVDSMTKLSTQQLDDMTEWVKEVAAQV